MQVNSAAKLAAEQAIAQVDMYTAQLAAARARETNAKLALCSAIDGENTAVRSLSLSSTTQSGSSTISRFLRPTMAMSQLWLWPLAPARCRRALAHVVHRHRWQRHHAGMFLSNGFQTIKEARKR